MRTTATTRVPFPDHKSLHTNTTLTNRGLKTAILRVDIARHGVETPPYRLITDWLRLMEPAAPGDDSASSPGFYFFPCIYKSNKPGTKTDIYRDICYPSLEGLYILPKNRFLKKLKVQPDEHSHGLGVGILVSQKRRMGSDDFGLWSPVIQITLYPKNPTPTVGRLPDRYHPARCGNPKTIG